VLLHNSYGHALFVSWNTALKTKQRLGRMRCWRSQLPSSRTGLETGLQGSCEPLLAPRRCGPYDFEVPWGKHDYNIYMWHVFDDAGRLVQYGLCEQCAPPTNTLSDSTDAVDLNHSSSLIGTIGHMRRIVWSAYLRLPNDASAARPPLSPPALNHGLLLYSQANTLTSALAKDHG
jgi:hypothetical protein